MRKTELIVALDVPSYEDGMTFVESLGDAVDWYKVGLELFISDGAAVVQALKRMKKKIMLDLKLHDIPETVGRAAKTAVDLGADMLTLHAAGGRKMMEAAVKGAADRVKLLGVTVLTSMDAVDLIEVGVGGGGVSSVAYQVAKLAELAGQAGLDGLVCSALEADHLHRSHPGFTLVTPGIRPVDGAAGDQKRVATPAMARESGASFIVVGRPIRDAHDRLAVVRSIQIELGNVV